MEREQRYLVFKISDIEAAYKHDLLSQGELFALTHIAEKVDKLREFIRGKEKLCAVVIEKDWPEYEKVWEMLEKRIEAENG